MQIPSDQNISFDEKPDMKANEITEATKAAILSGHYAFVRCNYANPDMVGRTVLKTKTWFVEPPLGRYFWKGNGVPCTLMQVGHTGNLEATIKACCCVDRCVQVMIPQC